MAQPADHPDVPDLACRRCHEPVVTGASTCPHCGHSVEVHDRRRLAFGTLGSILTLSVVGAPIGIPLLWLAIRHRRRYDEGVAGEVSDPVHADMGRVLRQQLSLEPRGVESHPTHRYP